MRLGTGDLHTRCSRPSRELRWVMACALLMLPAAAGAQDVRGVVRDSASGAPIPGAVVEVLDAGGVALGRAITNERGQYRALAPATARRLRVLRMGFRPQSIDFTGGARDIVMVAIPTLLETVTVREQAQCPRRSDRIQALALWEQARAGLLATVTARETNPGLMRRLSYRRIVGERRSMILSQVVHMDSALADRPFAAPRSAAAFLADGFVTMQAGTRVFDGPDADVLLDDAFPLGYCFRLATPEASRPTQVGLAFEPARRQRGRIDITGTLWVDSVSRALSELTFRYRGLPSEEENLDPGGSLTFRTMPNGLPVIDAWWLRLVAPRAVRDTSAAAPIVLARALHQTELHEIGGALASARWGDSTMWQASLGAVRGRLLLHGAAIPNTMIRLVGTDYRARSDDEGRFEIRELLPGRYVFALPDAALNAVGYELTHGQAFEVRSGSTAIADMIVPTDSSLINAKCGADPSGTMLIAAGRVLTSKGEPAQRASLEVFRVSTITGTRLERRPGRSFEGQGQAGAAATFFSVFDGEGGAGGKFWLCGVESNSHYVVEARRDGERGVASFVTTTPGKRRYTVSITMDPP